jgi:protein transport protein SEC24
MISTTARNVSADVRNYFAHRMRSMSVKTLMQFLYPRLLSLHDLKDDVAVPHPETGKIAWPNLMRDSHIYMEAHGVYLIGVFMIIVRTRNEHLKLEDGR